MLSISRRNILRAAGASAFVAPFASRFSGTAHAAGPKRFVLFWHANGAPKSGEYAMFDAAPGVNVIRGLSYSGSGDHKFGMPFSTTGRIDNPAKSISIDQAIAKATGKPALVLTGKAKHQNYRGWCSYDGAGKTVLPMENPRSAFASVFGVDPGGGGMTTTPTMPGTPVVPTAAYGPDVERKILEAALADMNELGKRVPQAEIGKMKAHLDALTTLTQGLSPVMASPLPGGITQQTMALTASECSDKTKLAVPFKEPSSGFDFRTRVNLHIELIIASFLCDARRVATLMVTPGGHDAMEFSFIGVPGADPHNTIAHSVERDAGAVTKMRKIKELDMSFLGRLIKRLKETPDPAGGSLYDSTAILATTECRHGNHGPSPIPIATAGGAAGGLGGGTYLDLLKSCARTFGASF